MALRWTENVHGSEVGGDEDPIVIGSDLQDCWIESAVRNNARNRSEVYGRLSSEQALTDIGIYLGVGLKGDSQASP